MRCLIKVSCLCLLLVHGAFGQGDRGTITGTVTDPTGAVFVGATVRAENSATHNAIETLPTDTGNFTLPQVPVGSWNVTVEAAGFKKFVSLNNTTEVAQTLRVDAKLEVGASPGYGVESGHKPLLTGGFGFINVNQIAARTARNVLVVARLAF